MKKRSSVILALFLVLGYGIYIFFLAPVVRERAAVRNIELRDVDLLGLTDGVYHGAYVDGTYEVEVVVADHRIAAIHMLITRDSDYARQAEGVLDSVVEAQSLQVDVVSGATTTSKAILKAVEDALHSPPNEPYISGIIHTKEENRILVVEGIESEDLEQEQWLEEGYEAIWLTVKTDTAVIAPEGKAAHGAALQKGQNVQAWVVGLILDSYPAQSTAGLIIIRE
ncbi:DUF3221 domain-containing protein [Dethiobacter alkaliphilus]|uniref:FMN-binding domain protein n=1 Tax=Dethiobacter alkaliphilus AHT 1 TaxID=555088 RepID=C0GK48_DETAL|nr:DUF3221 domain-containing protein [Dethiobacter alkaliphilus]EEG76318.1 FMN-binding domain protein [Dethiobacter alkaliphilus AHT 1]